MLKITHWRLKIKRKYEKVKRRKKFFKVGDYWSDRQLMKLKVVLKDVIDANYDCINCSIDWTEDELLRLKEVKERRVGEKHYDRFELVK